jgi:ectoine hydroxylase-related dioxygenase (phytanoyl-CoA dioxygenase family)
MTNPLPIEPRCEPMISRIVPSQLERTAGALESETIEQALRRFRSDGALIIENIVDTAIISEARREFVKSYSRYLDGSEPEDTLMVGDLRLSITVELVPPFDNPQLFANPYLLSVLSAALDDDFVIGAYGVVCSLPSAPAQHRHEDGGTLFQHSGIDRLLPAAAITVGIPLLEMNDVHGTTTLWLGTHRDVSRSSALRDRSQNCTLKHESIEPVVREGSCILWDFRLVHAGTPNRGALPRPLLYLTYCRPWFLDHKNYNTNQNPKQKPLLAKANFLSGLSERQQRLLVRARWG